MNLLRFKDLENRYTIEISKSLKHIYYNEFSKYDIHIKFLDSTNNVVLDILFNEFMYIKMILDLNDFNIEFGQIISNIIHIGSTNTTLNSYMILIGLLDDYNYISEDDNKINLYINIIENSIYGNKSRLYFELNINYLDQLIYKLFSIVEDLDNINTITEYIYNNYNIDLFY